ncbi:hypothetical protein F4820DRAFT_103259 [Hypoxylon rubiginosum]|uniref:Uncharacterized protein n=1 Tax=Hypoxylon rubiginosum TaxID=110542 RepID=A0ACB9ZBK5_9PEZI|nr:hypothetical protein F4820DRAFT_103259 [Hypoxylon rubiginosum]
MVERLSFPFPFSLLIDTLHFVLAYFLLVAVEYTRYTPSLIELAFESSYKGRPHSQPTMASQLEMFGAGFGRASRVLSRGIMVGSALVLRAMQHEGTFYQYLIISIFFISTLVHNALNWKAVVRHFFLAFVVVVIPILLTLPHSHIWLSFQPSRISIVLMVMSLFIEEYSRLVSPHSRHWERAPSQRRALLETDLEVNNRAVIFMNNGHGDLLLHTNGGGGRQYHPPSQASSEISLTTSAPGRLPSSCDTVVRGFWSESGQEDEIRRENDEEV